MVVQIDGGSSTNKGAQLMLYAVLQEIQSKHPAARIYLNNEHSDLPALRNTFKGLDIRKRQSNRWRNIVSKLKLASLAYKIYKPLSWRFSLRVPYKGVDILLNIGGFQFGDQWKHDTNSNASWKHYLSKMKEYGTKIIFLPQALGPFEKKGSREIVRILGAYSDIVMARDQVSYNYIDALHPSKAKISVFPDFTATVAGIPSSQSELAKGKVCIIPNSKMISQGVNTEEDFVNGIIHIIDHIQNVGRQVVLLNHEGPGDYRLCQSINESLNNKVEILQSNNALVTKGIIAASYLTISSRFHGVANALSSGVPCLATSWSHKYQKLMEDYGQKECMIDYSDKDDAVSKIEKLLNSEYNNIIRSTLKIAREKIIGINGDMWEAVWNS